MPDVLFKDVYGHKRLLDKERLASLSVYYQHKAPSFLPSLGCQCQAVNNRKLLQLYHLKIKFSIYYTLSTQRLLDINVTKNVHSTLQQIDPARNKKKWKEQVYLHVMFYYYSACLHLGKTKENFCIEGVIYVLGFINTGYFTSDNVPDRIKNATHNTFSNFRKKQGGNEIKIYRFGNYTV
jgi:hypothetical protein